MISLNNIVDGSIEDFRNLVFEKRKEWEPVFYGQTDITSEIDLVLDKFVGRMDMTMFMAVVQYCLRLERLQTDIYFPPFGKSGEIRKPASFTSVLPFKEREVFTKILMRLGPQALARRLAGGRDEELVAWLNHGLTCAKDRIKCMGTRRVEFILAVDQAAFIPLFERSVKDKTLSPMAHGKPGELMAKVQKGKDKNEMDYLAEGPAAEFCNKKGLFGTLVKVDTDEPMPTKKGTGFNIDDQAGQVEA